MNAASHAAANSPTVTEQSYGRAKSFVEDHAERGTVRDADYPALTYHLALALKRSHTEGVVSEWARTVFLANKVCGTIDRHDPPSCPVCKLVARLSRSGT